MSRRRLPTVRHTQQFQSGSAPLPNLLPRHNSHARLSPKPLRFSGLARTGVRIFLFYLLKLKHNLQQQLRLPRPTPRPRMDRQTHRLLQRQPSTINTRRPFRRRTLSLPPTLTRPLPGPVATPDPPRSPTIEWRRHATENNPGTATTIRRSAHTPIHPASALQRREACASAQHTGKSSARSSRASRPPRIQSMHRPLRRQFRAQTPLQRHRQRRLCTTPPCFQCRSHSGRGSRRAFRVRDVAASETK